MDLNWEAIGAIGEIVGALAVVISLLYLAAQIRTQNLESRIAAVHEINQSMINLVSQLQDPVKADLIIEAMSDWESCSASKRLRFIGYFIPVVRIYEDAFFQWKQGRLDKQTWETMLTQFTDFFSTEGAQHCWLLRRHQFRTDFVQYIDALEPSDYRL